MRKLLSSRTSQRTWLPLLALATAVAAWPSAARADLIAAYDHPVAGHGIDIGLVDLSTGRSLALPAGVNTTADESHPELSGDGSKLIFEHFGQVWIADLRTGRSSQPFFQLSEQTPGISPNGQCGLAGIGALRPSGESFQESALAFGSVDEPSSNLASAESDCGGPALQTLGPQDGDSACSDRFGRFNGFGFPGRGTADASIDDDSTMAWSTSTTTRNSAGSTVATWRLDEYRYTLSPSSNPTGISLPGQSTFAGGCLQLLGSLHGTSTTAYLQAARRFGTVTYTQVPILPSGSYGNGDIGSIFTERRSTATVQVPLLYPSGSPSDPTRVNTALDEHSPSWSADGRYLGFVRATRVPGSAEIGGPVREQIEVFDTQSQMLVDPTGFPIDTITPSNVHAIRAHVSIALDPTIFHLACTIGNLSVTCAFSSAAPAGILVMQVTGTHRAATVAGRRLAIRSAPALRRIGVVTLGHRPRHFRLDVRRLRVNGRPLKPGRYLLFIRARTRDLKRVRDVSRPLAVTIRR